MEYLLNKEQILIMKKIHEFNEKKLEKEKMKKYSSNNIFGDKYSEKEPNKVMLVEVKKDKWYQKLFLFFRKIFKK